MRAGSIVWVLCLLFALSMVGCARPGRQPLGGQVYSGKNVYIGGNYVGVVTDPMGKDADGDEAVIVQQPDGTITALKRSAIREHPDVFQTDDRTGPPVGPAPSPLGSPSPPTPLPEFDGGKPAYVVIDGFYTDSFHGVPANEPEYHKGHDYEFDVREVYVRNARGAVLRKKAAVEWLEAAYKEAQPVKVMYRDVKVQGKNYRVADTIDVARFRDIPREAVGAPDTGHNEQQPSVKPRKQQKRRKKLPTIPGGKQVELNRDKFPAAREEWISDGSRFPGELKGVRRESFLYYQFWCSSWEAVSVLTVEGDILKGSSAVDYINAQSEDALLRVTYTGTNSATVGSNPPAVLRAVEVLHP